MKYVCILGDFASISFGFFPFWEQLPWNNGAKIGVMLLPERNAAGAR